MGNSPMDSKKDNPSVDTKTDTTPKSHKATDPESYLAWKKHWQAKRKQWKERGKLREGSPLAKKMWDNRKMRAQLHDEKDEWIDTVINREAKPPQGRHEWIYGETCTGCNCAECMRVVLVDWKVSFLTEFNWKACGLDPEDYWQGRKCLLQLSDEQRKLLKDVKSDCTSRPILQCKCKPCWAEWEIWRAQGIKFL